MRIDASLLRVESEIQGGFLVGPRPRHPRTVQWVLAVRGGKTSGSMRNQKIDLAVRLDLIGLERTTRSDDTVRLSTNLQLLDADFTSGAAIGFTPQLAPKHLPRSVLARIGKDGGRAALTFTSVGEQHSADNNVAGFFLPSYEVVDASVECPLTARFAIGAGIDNLYDEEYASRVRPGGGGGFDPGAPRNVFVSISWKG